MEIQSNSKRIMRIDELRQNVSENARHFVDFPEVVFFDDLVEHIAKLPGTELIEFEVDGVVAVWIEFEYLDNKFFVDNALGDFRFHVENPECDESILLDVIDHLRRLLESG